MPPALAHTPSRPWWPRSKSSKDALRTHRSVSTIPDEDEKCPSSPSTSSKPKDAIPPRKFNTLASAIGFRSKKLPALTIQDPPSPRSPSHPYTNSRPGSGTSASSSPAVVDRTPFFTNRPPAKSVSTIRSSEYDYDAASDPHSEPRTPSDHPRDRLSYQHSVMTFTEMDPFASGGIIVQALRQDPNRLSVYSDSSMLDPQQKRPDIPPPMTHRVSYGSCSSNSHGNHSDVLSPLSATSFGRSPIISRSAYDLTQNNDQYSGDASATQAQRTHRTKTPSGSNSSNSTVTQHDFRNRLSEPPAGMRLPRKRSSPSLARPRGMTVGAIDHQPSPAPAAAVPDLPPLQLYRKESGSSSPSSSNTPSPSPVVFTRSRNPSCTTLESPASPNSTQPKVLLRKASASRVYIPPLPAAPPTASLPPTPNRLPPLSSSPYGLSPLEFRASSSSSSLDFAPSVGPHDLDPDEPIFQIVNDHYDLGPFQASKGKTRKNPSTDFLSGDSSSTRLSDFDLPSPLGNFPPVPTLVHGDMHPKAGKLLKKMSSQQSFSQRHSATSFMSTASGPLDDANGRINGHATPAKAPRKQRSFHAPRGIPLPLPPLPGLRSSSGGSSSANETLPPPCSPILEPRRGNVMSPRKRLFSGSSARRSTSSHGPTTVAEVDDKRSVFSFESEVRPLTSSGTETIGRSLDTIGGHSQGTRNGSISLSSLWDDGVGEIGTDKRMSQSDYVPQYIMSPAEQLKLAEKLEDEEAAASIHTSIHEEVDYPTRKPTLDLHPGDFGLTYSALPSATRSRSNSVLSHSSAGTLAFGDKAGATRGTSILSSRSSIKSDTSRLSPTNPSPRKVIGVDHPRSIPSRTISMLAKPVVRPPPLNVRPSTAQASITPPRSPQRACNPHTPHSPETPSASLPPPPRRRPSHHDLHDIEESTDKRNSVVPINALSPPPIRPANLRRQDSTDTATTVGSRPPSAYDRQKALQRRSIMKKPSFLDIEDDFDQSMDDGSDEDETGESLESPTMESSFLDMDRGKNSFDTVRSYDSASYVY
uniref:SH3 domain-containing protein n=1 Tax=Ganoderma boninense TaxID=34458 RepID=A0A5K1JXZ1_9APHY|nr:SH3 domain-containing protein [Ganoderma boninense]